jgi:thiopeptide-type bacteriocin biosynthesis protein
VSLRVDDRGVAVSIRKTQLNPTAMAWQSLHIYYERRQEPLLTECIGPLVSSARGRGLVRWFFLRYWKGGPHVRLRFQFEPAATPALGDALVARIVEYLRLNPSERRMTGDELERSQRVLAALEGEPADSIVVYPNNMVMPMPYLPEYEKYGGAVGVADAESLFDASSDVVMMLLHDAGGASTSRLGIALSMMLAAFRAAGYAEHEIVEAFAAYVRFCQRFVPAGTWQAWQTKVAERPEALRRCRAAMRVPDASRQPVWLQRWTAAFAAAARALRHHAEEVRPAVTLAGRMDPLQFVLFNYVHTHNNRLGVPPAVEAQIAHLAHESLVA